MQFIVAGRSEIERGIVVRTPYVVISISDPGSRRPRIKSTAGFRGAIYLQFHDAEPLPAATPTAEIVLMTAQQARRIWRFVAKNLNNVETIVVHCEQGASRSPAVVAGIADVLDIDVSEVLGWTQPNQFIVDLMRSVGRRIIGERSTS